MEPLFEAKALVGENYVLYRIFRLDTNRYRAELLPNPDEETATTAPNEMILQKANGEWQVEDSNDKALGGTIGIEIDVFNNGYGDILGRIGIQ